MAKYVRGMHHAKNAFHQRERLMPNEWLFHFIFCCLFLRFIFILLFYSLSFFSFRHSSLACVNVVLATINGTNTFQLHCIVCTARTLHDVARVCV